MIPTGAERRDPLAWIELLQRHKVTLWNSVPASFGALLDTLEAQDSEFPPTLRQVALSGDWIPLRLSDRTHKRKADVKVSSLGGATEASIWSVVFPIENIDPFWRSIPYGKPLHNQTMRVLHPNFSPCPTGVPGELFIGGAGVADGYLGDPERTKSNFSIHPRTQERLYRTGDFGLEGSTSAWRF